MPIVIVSGALANKPFNGGNAWTRLNWMLGFRRLGFDVYFVEEIGAKSCVDADGCPTTPRDSINVKYFHDTLERFDLQDHASLICDDGSPIYGPDLSSLEQIAAKADLLLNISGHLQIGSLKCPPRRKIFYDDDPGYTQIWHATEQLGSRLSGYDYYFTLGANIGSPDCSIPTEGIPWQKIRVPIVLEEWPPVASQKFDRFTTVASWRSPFGTIEFQGTKHGQKAHEFRKFVDLPGKTGMRFQLVLNIHPADGKDREAFTNAGWEICPPQLTDSPDAFRAYVQNSSAEFSVAQGLYVQTRSGWFSDRTVAYLASGKPALVQDTGFDKTIRTGEGLLTFTSVENAIQAVEKIRRDYARHCHVARALAEEYFDSDKVLGELLDRIKAGA